MLNRLTTQKAIIFILLFSAALRFLGIWHGYPFSYYPDEAHFVKRALSFGSFDFNPHWFHKPAFYMYLLFIDYGLLFVWGKLVGLWLSVSDFAVYYIINPGPFYIIGRITTACFGIATIAITYRIGERHFKKNVGIAAALFLTLSYGHVVACQDIKADIPAAFFAILSVWFLLTFLNSHRLLSLVFAAVSAGVGAATKVYPIVMLLPITLAVVWACWCQKSDISPLSRFSKMLRWSALAFCVVWLAYFLAAPFSFLDPLGRQSTFGGVYRLIEKATTLLGNAPPPSAPIDFIAEPVSTTQGFINYFVVLWRHTGMGLLIGLFGTFGVLFLVAQRRVKYYIFLLFPLAFIFISAWTFPGYAEPRHQLPIYPFFALSGGYLLVAIMEKSKKKGYVYAITGLLLCWPLFAILQRGFYVSQVDTRNLAKTWIEANIPVHSKIVMDENGPQLLQSTHVLNEMLNKATKADKNGQFTAHFGQYLQYQLLAAQNQKSYSIDEIRWPWWRENDTSADKHQLNSAYDRDMANPIRPVGVHTYKYYLQHDYKFAIVTSNYYQKAFSKTSKNALKFPTFAFFYKELFKRGKLVKEFSPESLNRPGPTVKIFKLVQKN
jgi:4-amino-4-deoxy-L-arabinose transferase-like glycosyltransferase